MDKEILVADEVAELLRVDRQRVYEICRTDPSFPVILIGQRQYRFSRAAVASWLERGGSNRDAKDEA